MKKRSLDLPIGKKSVSKEEGIVKAYESPVMHPIDCMTAQNILNASEEAFDINVSFDELWRSNA